MIRCPRLRCPRIEIKYPADEDFAPGAYLSPDWIFHRVLKEREGWVLANSTQTIPLGIKHARVAIALILLNYTLR